MTISNLLKKSLLMGLFLTFLGLSNAIAQTSLGILVGVVRDQSEAAVAAVNVTLVGNEDGVTRTATTQADGAYRIEALRPQSYTVTVNRTGFAAFVAKNVIVTPSDTTSYDIKLTVGSTNETVSVEADSISINTENGQLTGIVNSTDITKLPIFSNSPYELATTVPGAQYVADSGFSNGQALQINGARPRANNFLLDGQEINDVSIAGQAFQPNIPDSFSNVSVLTSSASAEFGRAGGGIVNSITKSGTNQYHGEVFERYTGSGLNALGGLQRGKGITKTRFDQHDLGFTAGGPIIRNKLFAFGGLAVTRYYGKLTPSVLEFPDQAGYATLQAIAAAAPGSTTPQVAQQVALFDSYVNSGVTSYLSSYNVVARTPITCANGAVAPVCTNVGPQPGCPAGGCIITEGFFQRPAPNANRPDTQWTYKIDYTPWQKDSFSWRYIHDRSSSNPDFTNSPGALIGFDTQQGGPSELGQATWTHIFTPNLLNEFRAAETRLSFSFSPTSQTLANPLSKLISISIGSTVPALGPNQNFPQGRGEDLYQFQDTVGWTKGRNSIRLGFDIGRQLEKDLVSQNAIGALSFIAAGTSTNGIIYGTSALGNYLQNQLGPSGTATKTYGNTRIDPHDWRSGFFGQDDIKLSPDLTVTLGLRYDYLTNPENSLKYPGIDTANPFNIITLVAGVPTGTVYKVQNPKDLISPRVGFAYSPHFGGFFGDGKFVLRGGFGIFFDSDFSNIVTNAAQTSPNAVSGLLTSGTGAGLTNATTLVPTIPSTLNLLSTVEVTDKNMVNPTTYQYNLGVERQLPWNIFVALRYVGNVGYKLFANQQYNYFSPLTPGIRLNPAYGQSVVRGNYANSNYNSLQVEVAHLFSHGFQVRGNYTYSKDLDNASEVFTTSSSATSYAANLAPGGFQQDWGPSAYDHRHYFVVSYTWSPAGFHSSNAMGNFALNVFTRNWSFSGISKFQSGTYSTFGENVDSNNDSSAANDRPILGNASAPINTAGEDGFFLKGGTPGVYYDINAFNSTSTLTPVSPGNVHWLVPHDQLNQNLSQEIGRNSFENPGLMFNDISVQKGIAIPKYERVQIVLRADVQDFANHNNINILNTVVNNIGNGLFLNRPNAELNAGRTMVLWGKVQF
jgi:outer membrane receptor protein involved in Fe transport